MCLQGFALVLEAPGRQKAVFLVCGFDFGLQVFGFSIGLEKKSARIQRTLICCVYYYWQFEHKTDKKFELMLTRRAKAYSEW